ncbi:MAG: 2-haloacid dehalogenase [Polaribacter sp.]|jgi:2-haloacid dehalogenase
MHNINTVIFDLGNVLINWDPNHLYKKIFSADEEREHFLNNICTSDWNVQQDAGRTLQEATEILVAQHPNYKNEIEAFYGRWTEMIGGAIQETVAILKQLKTENKVHLYALTNWSNETFPYAIENFEFLQLFEGILVSGDEKLIKPDTRIYELMMQRYNISPTEAVFIDDSEKNIVGAKAIGLHGLHFTESEKLRKELEELGLLGIVR